METKHINCRANSNSLNRQICCKLQHVTKKCFILHLEEKALSLLQRFNERCHLNQFRSTVQKILEGYIIKFQHDLHTFSVSSSLLLQAAHWESKRHAVGLAERGWKVGAAHGNAPAWEVQCWPQQAASEDAIWGTERSGWAGGVSGEQAQVETFVAQPLGCPPFNLPTGQKAWHNLEGESFETRTFWALQRLRNYKE